jgi:group I intron endonuclease
MIVYIAKNIVNGKKYIGYTTKSLEERIKGHLHKSRNKNDKHYFYLFKIALRKYGIDSFEWDILSKCTSVEECCEKEKFYIKTFDTLTPNGYNLTEGGNGGIQSQETKFKISESVKKYWFKNKEQHHWSNLDNQKRSEWALKSWSTKRNNGYIHFSGHSMSNESKTKMSETKNNKNKIKWYNVKTKESVELSLTKMSEYTKLSIGTFNHLKQGRQKQTKCGWTIETYG